MLWTPCLVRSSGPDGEVRASLGDPLVDDYLRFVAARSRPNTVLATAYDLKVFFSVVGKEPARVSTTDVMGFLVAQRTPRRGCARALTVGDPAYRTIKGILTAGTEHDGTTQPATGAAATAAFLRGPDQFGADDTNGVA